MDSFLVRLKKTIITSPALPAAAVFLLVMTVSPHQGGANQDARLATMAALTSEGTFAITNFPWTIDWAKSPINGKIYANKGPGPAIVGAPVYWVIDSLAPSLNGVSRYQQRTEDRQSYGHVISLLLQALPYAILVCVIARWLHGRVGGSGMHFATWAFLFGTTASLFMNTYFGHGMAALGILSATYFSLRQRYAWAGFFLGWAALSDYGAALLVLPFLVSVVIREGRQMAQPLALLACGAALPAAIWLFFHTSIFGHPLHIASRYSNPMFVSATTTYTTWGMFSPLAHWQTVWALLFGTQRGILFTQPWVFIVLIASVWVALKRKAGDRNFAGITFFAVVGFLLLLWVNSSFNGWHGGQSAGPRYLSSILPVFGLLAALMFDSVPRFWRWLMWVLLMPPVVIFALVHATTILLKFVPLWPFYVEAVFTTTSIVPTTRTIGTLALLGLAALVTARHQHVR